MKPSDLLNPEINEIVDKKVKQHLKIFGMEHLKSETIEKAINDKIDRQDNSARLNRMGETQFFKR